MRIHQNFCFQQWKDKEVVISKDGDFIIISKEDLHNLPGWAVALIVIGKSDIWRVFIYIWISSYISDIYGQIFYAEYSASRIRQDIWL